MGFNIEYHKSLTLKENILVFFENLSRGWAYFKQGFNSPDWDYAYLYGDIAFKLKRMEQAMENGMHVDNKRTAHEIKVARLALERLMKDDYVESLRGWVTEDSLRKALNKHSFDYEEKMKEQDLFLFASQFIKHSRTWWD